MPSFTVATVVEVTETRPGLQRVRLGDGSRAYVTTQLVGPVAVGDEVVINTTAVELELGTGGWHVVHWNLARSTWAEAGPGHIMKLRYTSLQTDTGAAEERHDAPADLGGIPVVAAGLHSQLPAIVVAVKAARATARISYVMTDGAALPLALSDLVIQLRARGLLAGTITAGHAFGGDLEAVNVVSALALARHVQRADLVVVAMGPGVVGTGTALGTTAVEVAPILDAADALGGRPVACLRVSDTDARNRHRGVSHHSLTALRLVRCEVDVAVPPGMAVDLGGRHRVHSIDPPDVGTLLAVAGLTVTTMGRGPDQEPRFFAACGAAGALAASFLEPT